MILRGFLLVIMILGSYGISFSMGPAELVADGRYEEAIDSYKEAIETSQDNKEKAMLHKELGGLFVSKDDFKGAAEEFIKALSLYRGFSADERLKMSVYISWGDRLDEAVTEIRSILLENPENVEARIHLARFLSWSGRLKEAIDEADRVIKEYPDDRAALLVKANSLNWKGDPKKAIPIFKKLLEEEEDFDTRIGLAYAYLSSGNRRGVLESIKFLKPEYPYQERELKKLNEAMEKTTKSNLDIRYSFYEDTDDNRLNRYLLSSSFWTGNLKMDLGYRHTDAKGGTGDGRAEDLSFTIYSKVTESLGVGAGLVLNQLSNDNTTNFASGHIKDDANISNGTIGASISWEVLAETTQLIENRIRLTNIGIYISQGFNRLSLYGGYNHKDYSDENSANDFQLASRYAFSIKNPAITLGYKLRYLDFNRQSGNGYFDPSGFISNQIFISSTLEKGKFYGHIEPFIGYQSFKRSGSKSSDLISGANATVGYNLTKDFLFEANAEGGNYAVGTAAGFKYYLISLRLSAFF